MLGKLRFRVLLQALLRRKKRCAVKSTLGEEVTGPGDHPATQADTSVLLVADLPPLPPSSRLRLEQLRSARRAGVPPPPSHPSLSSKVNGLHTTSATHNPGVNAHDIEGNKETLGPHSPPSMEAMKALIPPKPSPRQRRHFDFMWDFSGGYNSTHLLTHSLNPPNGVAAMHRSDWNAPLKRRRVSDPLPPVPMPRIKSAQGCPVPRPRNSSSSSTTQA